MIINAEELGRQYLPLVQQQSPLKGVEPDKDGSFSNILKEFISDVNSLQLDSKKQTDAFIKGEPVDIHDVMISAEKAKISFQLLLEIRNKALDLYREINRLQV